MRNKVELGVIWCLTRLSTRRMIRPMNSTHGHQVAFLEALWYAGYEALAHCVARYYGLVLEPVALRYANSRQAR